MSSTAEKTAKTMSGLIATTWQTYVEAWNARDRSERERFLSSAVDVNSNYVDPNVDIKGHQALSDYMGEFHAQMPGATFVLTRFISHHQKSIASWNLHDENGGVLFSGISYGTYNAQGKLTAEHGFFDTPGAE